ncbi:hypothetical protein AKJ41_02060 [candidate division MSBL1 archaeon SCGC-AAA259O05]|uniref:Uncharacterized protein n=1 Tax=candidate division MSBL1 archaeon SCGC-AAA259O05 TaxID=1698271 RepID=A0A133V4E5_9EURY|nr:hypothetical protein AKJ41_02060 [candidate division MSBL1 archaeon SCGC-AAA259O05]
MAGEGKILKQLTSFERTIFQIGEKAFDRHSRDCSHQIPKGSGTDLCGLTGDKCAFQMCPLLAPDGEEKANEGE